MTLAEALDVIGERWTLLILRDAFFGARRFQQFQFSLGQEHPDGAAQPPRGRGHPREATRAGRRG
jgi:hypothetical protein